MTKWADYAITHVNYNDDHTRISIVKRRIDLGDDLGEPSIKTRTEIVNSINNGSSHSTAYYKNGKWQKGDDVIAYELDGTYFIRTDGNRKKEDNLGSLPEF